MIQKIDYDTFDARYSEEKRREFNSAKHFLINALMQSGVEFNADKKKFDVVFSINGQDVDLFEFSETYMSSWQHVLMKEADELTKDKLNEIDDILNGLKSHFKEKFGLKDED